MNWRLIFSLIRTQKRLVLCIPFIALLSTNSFADDFLAAKALAVSGKYGQAMSIYERLAKSGDNRAQAAMASLYLFGLGTQKNQKLAFGRFWTTFGYVYGLTILLKNIHRALLRCVKASQK